MYFFEILNLIQAIHVPRGDRRGRGDQLRGLHEQGLPPPVPPAALQIAVGPTHARRPIELRF